MFIPREKYQVCLLTAAYQVIPDWPVFILANREESLQRASAGPRINTPAVNESAFSWVGGVDLAAGGTWLGVNECSVVVAVTNRPKIRIPPKPPSRGTLCRLLLEQSTADTAMELAKSELETGRYAGCNIVILAPNQAGIVEAGDDFHFDRLDSGIHLITNGTLNDPHDRRIDRVHQMLEQGVDNRCTVDDWITAAKSIGSAHEGDGQAAVCLHGETWGTVSSTIVGISSLPDRSLYLYANGTPCNAEYEDVSPLLRKQFKERRTSPR